MMNFVSSFFEVTDEGILQPFRLRTDILKAWQTTLLPVERDLSAPTSFTALLAEAIGQSARQLSRPASKNLLRCGTGSSCAKPTSPTADVDSQCLRGHGLRAAPGALPSVPRSVKEPRPSHESNTAEPFNVLEGARLAGVKRAVYAASSRPTATSPAFLV